MYKLFLLLLVLGFVVSFLKVDFSTDKENAYQESAKIAPLTSEFLEPVFQVYEAREYKWKGLVSTHSWIAIKPSYSRHYTVYQINEAKNLGKAHSFIEIKEDIPDRFWYGNQPTLICDLRGRDAAAAIRKLKRIVEVYPYKSQYEFFPGPNANTFTAYVMGHIEEVKGSLSPIALGKDFHESTINLEKTASNTGYKISIKGLCCFTLSKNEGASLSLFGVTFGINPGQKQLILPLVGIIHY